MEPLFGLDAQTANSLLIACGTIIATIVASYIGGRVGANATRRAAELTLREAQRRDEANRLAVLRGVLMGIRTELDVMWTVYHNEIGPRIEELRPGEGYSLVFPMSQTYFHIYEANAGLIGQIEDDKLRASLISTHIAIQQLIETHKYNNSLIEAHNYLLRNHGDMGRVNAAFAQIQNYGRNVRNSYTNATARVQELFAIMDGSKLLAGPHNDSKNDRVSAHSSVARSTPPAARSPDSERC